MTIHPLLHLVTILLLQIILHPLLVLTLLQVTPATGEITPPIVPILEMPEELFLLNPPETSSPGLSMCWEITLPNMMIKTEKKMILIIWTLSLVEQLSATM